MLLLIHVAGTGIVRVTVDQRSCATLDEDRKAGVAGPDECPPESTLRACNALRLRDSMPTLWHSVRTR